MPNFNTSSDRPVRTAIALAALAWSVLLSAELPFAAPAVVPLLAVLLAIAGWQHALRLNRSGWLTRILLGNAAMVMFCAALDGAALDAFPFRYRVLRTGADLVWIGAGVAGLAWSGARVADRVQHGIVATLVAVLGVAYLLPRVWQGWPTGATLEALCAACAGAAAGAWLCLRLLCAHAAVRESGRETPP